MEAAAAAIVAALIGGPLMWWLDRRNSKRVAQLDANNTQQHDDSFAVLMRLEGKVDNVDGKVDDLGAEVRGHLRWHLEQFSVPLEDVS